MNQDDLTYITELWQFETGKSGARHCRFQTKIGLTTFDARDPESKYPPIEPLRPPEGAPNVFVVLIDDVGFGASSAFGGPCRTPNFERLAADGLRYTRFHTTALCSPTRAALLTGRNHHTVGMGSITELATSAPGQNSMRPNTCAPLVEILKLNGYSTAQFGKCHEVPVWETSPLGPFDHWPSGGGGFEYFYGFIGGETFMYFAPGATHAPHHVPREWSDKYKGKFDQGWDKLRQETFARQRRLGVIPPDCQLTERHPEIPAWGRYLAGNETRACAPDGDLRGLPGAHRSSGGTSPGMPRRSADSE